MISGKLFASEERRPKSLGLLGALVDAELSEQGLPGDVNTVPLVFQAAQCTFVKFAHVANGRRALDEG